MKLGKMVKQEVVYFHINNGGVHIKCTEDTLGGPYLVIEASHFGVKTNSMKLPVNSDILKQLGKYLIKHSKKKYKGFKGYLKDIITFSIKTHKEEKE